MLDWLGGFNATKLKPQLKMAVQRINLIKNKKTNQVKAKKREIAELLRDDKEEKARIKVENIIREDFTIEAYEIIELLCELMCERMALIKSEKQCPYDMNEAVCTLIWAANKTEVSELMAVRKQLTAKYGKDFAVRAMNDQGPGDQHCVNERVKHKLSVQPANAFLVISYLKEIAKQFKVNWEPSEELNLDDMSQPMPAPTGSSVGQAATSTFTDVYNPPLPAPNLGTDGVDGNAAMNNGQQLPELPVLPMLPAQPGMMPMPQQPGMMPMPQQPGMMPMPQQPGMMPMPQQPGMMPMPQQPGMMPMPQQPGMMPMPQQPGMMPMPQQPGMMPMPQQPGMMPMPQQPGMMPMPQQPGMMPMPQQPGMMPMPQQPGMMSMPQQPGMMPMPQQPGMMPMPQQPGMMPMPPETQSAPAAQAPTTMDFPPIAPVDSAPSSGGGAGDGGLGLPSPPVPPSSTMPSESGSGSGDAEYDALQARFAALANK